jgi:cyclase
MPRVRDRRGFLSASARLLGAGVLASIVGPRRGATQNAAGVLVVVTLRDGLVQIRGPSSNALLLAERDGALLVDSGTAETSAELQHALDERLAGARVGTLINTHWHPDHTGGNDAFGKAGAKIAAHENTRLWMSTEYHVDWQRRTYEPRAPEALPNATFFSSDPQPLALEIGGEHVEYGHLREAHTDGDVYVHFRERNVIAAGGAVGGGAYPILDPATGGWIGGLVEAQVKLLALTNEETLIVPHSGPAQSRAELEEQLAMLRTVRERVENLMRKGRSAAEMIAAGVTAEFDARYGGDGPRFIRNMYDGLWWTGRLTNSL